MYVCRHCWLAASIILVFSTGVSMASAASTSSHTHQTAVSVVRELFSFPAPLTNAAAASVVSLYAPGATLTSADYTGKIYRFHGHAGIGSYYSAFVGKGLGSLDTVRSLGKTMVITYGRNQIPGHAVISRFADVFVVKGGKITSEDRITFWRNPK